MRLTAPNFPSSRTKDGALYLDNAATSWPKPPEVAQAMARFLEETGANPGRSGHRLSIEAARLVYETRVAVSEMFGAEDPVRGVFGLNITDGLNLALHGLLKSGDHVITSSVEHNAVMRPLNDLAQKGVQVTKVACNGDGSLDAILVEAAIQSNTRLIVLNHASNVCGTILPIKEVGQIARKHGVLFLLDCAQTAGVLPIDMEADGIDLLAFTGHKSLYGPMGTGGLVVGPRLKPSALLPIRQGGTGSRSEQEVQPDFFPDRYESGTPNALGLAGLLAALNWLKAEGIEAIREREEVLCSELLAALVEIEGVELYGTRDASKQTATVAFNIRGMEASTVGLHLNKKFDILCRVGLHCAPSAHHSLGSFPEGSVRFGLGAFNNLEDVRFAVDAVRQLAKEAR